MSTFTFTLVVEGPDLQSDEVIDAFDANMQVVAAADGARPAERRSH